MQPERTVHYESYYKQDADPVPRFDFLEVPAIGNTIPSQFNALDRSLSTFLSDHNRDWGVYCLPYAVASTSVYFLSRRVRDDMVKIIRTAAEDKVMPRFAYENQSGYTEVADVLGARAREADGLFLILRMPLIPPPQYYTVG